MNTNANYKAGMLNDFCNVRGKREEELKLKIFEAASSGGQAELDHVKIMKKIFEFCDSPEEVAFSSFVAGCLLGAISPRMENARNDFSNLNEPSQRFNFVQINVEGTNLEDVFSVSRERLEHITHPIAKLVLDKAELGESFDAILSLTSTANEAIAAAYVLGVTFYRFGAYGDL